MVVFIKTKSLQGLTNLSMKTLGDVQNLHWEDNSLPKKIEFKDCLLSDIQTVSYATISCLSGCQWSTLTEFMFGLNGVTSEFVFLDALCVNPMDKGPAVSNVRWKIMEHSQEHHIIELDCFLGDKVWQDLAFIDPEVRPTVHYSKNDPESQTLLMEKVREKGLEYHHELVLSHSISCRWKSVKDFNNRINDVINNALDLSQVGIFLISVAYH